jgi:hypothetical protein
MKILQEQEVLRNDRALLICVASSPPFLNSFFLLLIDTRLGERSSLVTAGRRIYFESDAGEGTSLPA